MEIEQLKERIAKKQAQIAKIEKRIAKWEAAKSDKGFKKEYDWLAQDGMFWDNSTESYSKPYETFKAERYAEYEKNCNDEIRRANSDLDDAKVTITKYENMLKMEEVKQGKLSEERIKVLADFLENWKKEVTEYVHKNMKVYLKYHELDHEYCDLRNYSYKYINDGTYADKEAVKNKLAELSKERKATLERVGDITREVYTRKNESHVNEELLKEILDKEADNKYIKMVDAITDKVGTITDASSLYIGPKGDIEGYIFGTDGKVHIQTIGAGGYNIQCYHFRCLIKKIK